MTNMRNVSLQRPAAHRASLLAVGGRGPLASSVPVFILPAPSKVAVALYRGLASGLYLDPPAR